MIVVGSVPYVNARPLVQWFEEMGAKSPVAVRYDVPSQLPTMLESGGVAAILVSSYYALSKPGARIAEGICIGSQGPVESVRLFSKVPFDQIRRLALDRSSMTSNHLAQILLAECYGVHPETAICPSNLETMLRDFDAGILIGDLGMAADGTGLHVLDLGQAWDELTSLPFVWAVWSGFERMDSDLVSLLNASRLMSYVGRNPNQGMQSLRREMFLDIVRRYDPEYERDGMRQRAKVVDDAADRSGWDRADASRYLTETIVYDLSPMARDGMDLYRRKLVQHGFLNSEGMPEIVEPVLKLIV